MTRHGTIWGAPVSRDDRVLRPFWLHQAAEYLLGLVLVAQGLQSPTPVVPSVAGGIVLLNAACVEGPLAAFRLVSRRAHRWADLVVIGMLVVAAALPWLDVDNTSRVLMVIVAVILTVVWWNSSFAAPAPARGTRWSTAARRWGGSPGAPSAAPSRRHDAGTASVVRR